MTESSREIHINLNSGTIVRFFLFTILLFALYYLSDVLLVIVAAIVIASAIEPLIRRLKRKRVHRMVSVIGVYIIIACILAVLVIFFMPMVINDTINFLDNLPATISFDNLWSPINDASTALGDSSVISHNIPISEFVNGFRQLIVGTSSGVFQTVSALFGGVLGFLLIIVLSFYLAAREGGVDDFLRIISPVKHHDYIIDLWARSQRKIALWLQGQVVLGIIVGVLVYVVLTIVGIPNALLLAVFAGMMEIIPVFGPIISSIPAVIIAFSERGLGTGILLICLYLVIHQFESHLFYPLVVKKIVGISPIVVILALVIGAKLAGVLGALIAVPLSAAFMEYIHDIEKYKKAEIAERETVGKQAEG